MTEVPSLDARRNTLTTHSSKNNKLSWFVFLFFLCTSLLMGSGRLGSLDAGDQLQAAFYAVHHGQYGALVPPGGMQHTIVQGKPAYIPVHFWWQAPNGLYYQTHDIGDITVFTPIAFAVSHLSKATPQQQIDDPPLVAKLCISLLFSAFGGMTAFLLFQTLRLFLPQRSALIFAALFLPTTFLWPFCKTVWDLAPAALFATLQLYCCARILTQTKEIPVSLVAGAALAATLAASFRFSFVVFLVLGLALTLFCVRSFVRPIHYAVAIGVVFLGMLPSFISNHIRMGAFWHPATLIPRYVDAGTATMDGNFFRGFFGQTFSPNKGMFIYCPIFLLLFALPVTWRRFTLPMRQVCGIFLFIGVGYLCAISKIPSWSGYIGWGPRYAVLVLPFFYLSVALITATLWREAKRSQMVRAGLVLLFALTVINNFPPSVVNWPLAVAEDEQAHNQYANGFYAQRAVWRGLALGLEGKPIPMRASLESDPKFVANAQFPDLWLARLFQKGGKTAAVGAVIFLGLAGSALFSLLKILRIMRGTSTTETVPNS